MQEAYDGLCIKGGTTAVPYFLTKYTDDTVQIAPLGDWDTFFTDAKKVLLFYLFNFFKATDKNLSSKNETDNKMSECVSDCSVQT